MDRRRIRLFQAVSTVLTLVLMTLFTSTAFGQSSGAAEHFDYTRCDPTTEGYTFCFSTDSVYHSAVTPSGTTHLTGNGQSSLTLIDPSGALVYQTVDKFHFAELTREGMIEVYNNTGQGTIFYPDGTSCDYSFLFRLIGGEIRVFREDSC